jgi:hypothetical protein
VDFKAGVGGAGIASVGEAGREMNLVKETHRLHGPPLQEASGPQKRCSLCFPMLCLVTVGVIGEW